MKQRHGDPQCLHLREAVSQPVKAKYVTLPLSYADSQKASVHESNKLETTAD